MPQRKRILITLTGGGFLWEAKTLIKGLGDGFEYHYVTTPDSTFGIGEDIPPEYLYLVSKITSLTETKLHRRLHNALSSFYDSYKVIKQVDPEAVICIGSSIAVPLCFWGRVFGKKTIFVESITRVSKPSSTGKILSFFRLCDRFYVQWPEAEKLYRGSICRGTIL